MGLDKYMILFNSLSGCAFLVAAAWKFDAVSFVHLSSLQVSLLLRPHVILSIFWISLTVIVSLYKSSISLNLLVLMSYTSLKGRSGSSLTFC